MRHIRLFLIGFASTALFSCGGDDLVLPSEGEPAAVTIVQGNGVSGRVGEALAEPLIVEVLDGARRPVARATVVVEITGAVAEPDTISTDAQGRASTEITLGSQVGESTGEVRVIDPESPVAVEASFTVVALASSANGLAGVSGDEQAAPAGTELPDLLVVEVTDAFGNPIAGVEIVWTAEGGGSISAPSTTTDGEGRTSVTRTLGPTAGAQTTLATSEGLAGSPVVFTHTVTAGNASGVLIVDGNDQTAAPRTTLPKDLLVQVVDQSGNPVVSAPVTWVGTAGGGTLAPTTGTTDENGRAATKWTLGPSVGTNTAQAVVSGVGQAEFTATAAAGTASQIRVVSGDDQTGQAGTRLGSALVVEVLDDGDNPVSGVAVTWTVQAGGGSVSPASATTGGDGQASTAWTLGSAVGTQRVGASAPGAGSVQFEAVSSAGAPSVLALTTQPSGTAQVGAELGRQPVIQVRDAAGNPVGASGVTVTAAIATGGGQLLGTRTQRTGANGRVTFTNLAIGDATGAHSLIFAASGFTSVTSSSIQVNPAPTTTRITADSPDPSEPGANIEVVFNVTSPGGTPSGTVQVTVSGGSETCSATVSAGRCTLALTGEGERTLTARFQGGGLFTASSGTTTQRVVPPSPIGTTTSIVSDAPDPSAPGQAIEVVFEVTSSEGAPPGTVQVTASGGSESCSASVAEGRCSLVLTAEGARTLAAGYQGSGLFTASSGTAAHSVVTPDTPPTAADDGYSATAGVLLSVAAPGVLGNDSDVDGDPLSAQLLTGPSFGALTLNADGSFDYTPNAGFFGQDSFTYQVTAGSATDAATATIIVN